MSTFINILEDFSTFISRHFGILKLNLIRDSPFKIIVLAATFSDRIQTSRNHSMVQPSFKNKESNHVYIYSDSIYSLSILPLNNLYVRELLAGRDLLCGRLLEALADRDVGLLPVRLLLALLPRLLPRLDGRLDRPRP